MYVRRVVTREKLRKKKSLPKLRAKMLSRTNVSLPLLEATLGVGA
jgi:hypothetical protein